MHALDLGRNAPRRLLCLGAHCDDLEIGCGGSILTLLRALPDLEIDWVVFSGGPLREAEARSAAAEILGGRKAEITIRSFTDGFFPAETGAIKSFFNEIAARTRPDLVFTHFRGDLHQDHRTLGELTWQTFRNTLIWEYEIPKFDGDLGRPNLFIPLQEDIARQKIDIILRSFTSQAAKSWFTASTFEALMRLRGIESGGGAPGLAEGFHASKIVVQP